jgi:hypothetical protein
MLFEFEFVAGFPFSIGYGRIDAVTGMASILFDDDHGCSTIRLAHEKC